MCVCMLPLQIFVCIIQLTDVDLWQWFHRHAYNGLILFWSYLCYYWREESCFSPYASEGTVKRGLEISPQSAIIGSGERVMDLRRSWRHMEGFPRCLSFLLLWQFLLSLWMSICRHGECPMITWLKERRLKDRSTDVLDTLSVPCRNEQLSRTTVTDSGEGPSSWWVGLWAATQLCILLEWWGNQMCDCIFTYGLNNTYFCPSRLLLSVISVSHRNQYWVSDMHHSRVVRYWPGSAWTTLNCFHLGKGQCAFSLLE